MPGAENEGPTGSESFWSSAGADGILEADSGTVVVVLSGGRPGMSVSNLSFTQTEWMTTELVDEPWIYEGARVHGKIGQGNIESSPPGVEHPAG
jgi:hypothetical protein